jgi:hypothetical protein
MSQRDAMRAGIGDWSGFMCSPYTIHDVLDAAESWKAALNGVERAWLCWNVDPDWCLVQQRMVESVGWTPVVGFDPRVGPPPLSPNAILIDFNAAFGLPVMYPHFPLEFAFAFADKLAFWHSDLLLRPEKLKRMADLFERLEDGQMAATEPGSSLKSRILKRYELRYWELLGCMTKQASLNNFQSGCGWWLCFYLHPNIDADEERKKRMKYHWECGVGIRYWHKIVGGQLVSIPEADIDEGHFTRIRRESYVRAAPDDWRRNLPAELSKNFSLSAACNELGLSEFLK